MRLIARPNLEETMTDKSAQPAPQKPKLTLKRETLRVLNGELLDAVVGGLMAAPSDVYEPTSGYTISIDTWA
jgi:hypothetical protein